MALNLTANKRNDFTRSSTKKLREEGQLPAVFYGKGSNQPISLDRLDFVKTVREGGINGVITLTVDKSKHSVMVQDLQMDHLKDLIIHADFKEINLNEETDADVPIHLVGEAAGAKEGGVVQHFLHDVSIRALPADIPSEIEVNVEELNISDAFTVADLIENSSYQILTDPEEVVVSVTPPTEEPEEEEAEETDAEPEVIKESDKTEGEENDKE
ncbi:50S ribosomal protein L25/general stress protein Ctc [Alkalihalobacillus sp. AL-G]|uniref:50S ribosomal protein L25/general stress protein Ctc n=1 Tax=Alkalihalobacillus sp. AL-G TaxID=2926399 RepID=UPI0027298464|nr:50S ribosomal protein L25/general stress protein Ctc [Alkalihalobacillus sp. AL-G]WLD93462.1 50S ribosomal protein L25/general stress protein Ctc [Alkalihalobacillus sp. AL-G]